MGCCPECGSGDIELDRQDCNDRWSEIEEYHCQECGCEWEWAITLHILTHGEIDG